MNETTIDPADLPIDDAELSYDPQVAELEQRIATGDDTVTADQLAATRTAAAGRVRFARLRAFAADRQASRDAERAEQLAAVAADDHARTVLAPYAPAELVPLYDRAVDAVRAYVAAVEGRNAAILELTRLPVVDRVRNAVVDVNAHSNNALTVDGHQYRHQITGAHVKRVLAAARVGVARGGRGLHVVGPEFAVDDQDPSIVAEGRAQLDTAGGAA